MFDNETKVQRDWDEDDTPRTRCPIYGVCIGQPCVLSEGHERRERNEDYLPQRVQCLLRSALHSVAELPYCIDGLTRAVNAIDTSDPNSLQAFEVTGAIKEALKCYEQRHRS